MESGCFINATYFIYTVYTSPGAEVVTNSMQATPSFRTLSLNTDARFPMATLLQELTLVRKVRAENKLLLFATALPKRTTKCTTPQRFPRLNTAHRLRGTCETMCNKHHLEQYDQHQSAPRLLPQLHTIDPCDSQNLSPLVWSWGIYTLFKPQRFNLSLKSPHSLYLSSELITWAQLHPPPSSVTS